MRRHIAAAVIACLVASSFMECSHPMDPGSPAPAQYQPLLFLLGALGVGVLLTAVHHHNEQHGGAPTPSLTAPTFVEGLGNQPFDIALDPSQPGAVGALGTSGGGGRYGFVEVGSSGANNGSYGLPTGYAPRALAIDGGGNDWFVDDAGAVRKCPPPSSLITQCVPSLSFLDGLISSGFRSIAADLTHVFIALDNQIGTVFWVAFALDGSGRIAGSYAYAPGLGAFSADAAVATTGSAVSVFTIFHKDGASWTVALPGPATRNPFKFSPPPVPTENIATDGLGNYYGFLGSATGGAYQIGHYVGVGNAFAVAPGSLISNIAIAFNGVTSPNGGHFTVPLAAARTDGFLIYTLDSSGNLVVFQVF